jgi:hypothetical protein
MWIYIGSCEKICELSAESKAVLPMEVVLFCNSCETHRPPSRSWTQKIGLPRAGYDSCEPIQLVCLRSFPSQTGLMLPWSESVLREPTEGEISAGCSTCCVWQYSQVPITPTTNEVHHTNQVQQQDFCNSSIDSGHFWI